MIGENTISKYRVAIIGCGGIGQKHAQGVVGLDNAEVVAGCDISQQTLNVFKEKYGGHWSNISLYTDYSSRKVKYGEFFGKLPIHHTISH